MIFSCIQALALTHGGFLKIEKQKRREDKKYKKHPGVCTGKLHVFSALSFSFSLSHTHSLSLPLPLSLSLSPSLPPLSPSLSVSLSLSPSLSPSLPPSLSLPPLSLSISFPLYQLHHHDQMLERERWRSTDHNITDQGAADFLGYGYGELSVMFLVLLFWQVSLLWVLQD